MEVEFICEAQCPVCSKWLPQDRRCRRALLDEVPLHDPICPRCFVAFWTNMGMMKADGEIEAWLEGTKH
jgi:hypothetical protein